MSPPEEGIPPVTAPVPAPLSVDELSEKMRQDWDERARQNARFFVNTEREDWTDEEFFWTGEQTLQEEILNDMINICQEKPPRRMKVLEIGCGAGRVTRALSKVFGEVHAVDVSGEMVECARRALEPHPNAHVYQNNGRDLSVVGDIQVDFAFSTIVFQHISSRDIIESYIREVCRLLRPGALFKFQVQGDSSTQPGDADTWIGVSFSTEDAREMAERCGFEMRYCYGGGTQYFWLWYFKRR